MQCSSTMSCLPSARIASTASCTSERDDAPVERMIGLPFPATWRSNGRWVTSIDAILNGGTPNPSRKSVQASSHGVENKAIPCSFASACKVRYCSRVNRGWISANSSYWVRPGPGISQNFGASRVTSVSGENDCSLIASAPARAAAATISCARAKSFSWLQPASAITNTGCPGPICRLPMSIARISAPRAQGRKLPLQTRHDTLDVIRRHAGMERETQLPPQHTLRDREHPLPSTEHPAHHRLQVAGRPIQPFTLNPLFQQRAPQALDLYRRFHEDHELVPTRPASRIRRNRLHPRHCL